MWFWGAVRHRKPYFRLICFLISFSLISTCTLTLHFPYLMIDDQLGVQTVLLSDDILYICTLCDVDRPVMSVPHILFHPSARYLITKCIINWLKLEILWDHGLRSEPHSPNKYKSKRKRNVNYGGTEEKQTADQLDSWLGVEPSVRSERYTVQKCIKIPKIWVLTPDIDWISLIWYLCRLIVFISSIQLHET